ncbi:MAG: aminotransferase class III-fold pyridoxal phosphate-dependent enzyme, partial [Actinomycetota bacterium]|nr:aminotransferase class III-fold pyridoxal phosphate-dependent enzyme [Actinomycetota bacterium]
VVDRFGERVRPRWPALRAQVVHGDFTVDNVLFDERERIAGVVDFGDIVHTALVADFAVGLSSLLRARAGEDVFRAARAAIDGYASALPLEPEELTVLADLVAARLAALVTISAWRSRRFPENLDYIQAWDADSWALLDLFADVGADRVAAELGAPRPHPSTGELARRRQRVLGPALTPLTYRAPVHVARGEGVWLFDSAGRRLLDAYNNVPVVGHCHPRVTEAVVRQTRTVNTHARYLYAPLVELGERLVETMPRGSGLDTVMVVNSGSEANDLAWRIVTATSGRSGAIVTAHAYHGMTAATSDLSPEEWRGGFAPLHVQTIAPPGSGSSTAAEMARATAALDEHGIGLAATYVDGGFTSEGILVPAVDEVAELAEATRAAGGLVVADEVQAGHGRTGEHLWSFARYGITPDIVTLGKPMGNGYPVAAVVTRKELVEHLAVTTSFFSTFGGNPVAAQAALAVLDVIEDEALVAGAARMGSALLRGLLEAAGEHPLVREVRGHGLLVGVDLAASDGEAADGELAERVVDRLRERKVLVGRTGPRGNVLKIRPPLVFDDEHVPILAGALAASLADEAT